MKKLLVVILVLVIGVGVLGYFQGWYSFTRDDAGKLRVTTDPEKFKKDRAAFSAKVSSTAKSVKEKVAGLRKKSESLPADEKTQAEKDLAVLEKQHDQLEKQLKELEATEGDNFEKLKLDLTNAMEEVNKKMEELTTKIEKGQPK